MLILVLDSCGSFCEAGLWRDGVVLAQKREAMERGQDARLVPLVQEVMAQAGVEFSALDRIAVPRGPGSFTGVRVCLAAARGLGLALGKPVLGIDRFSLFRAASGGVGAALVVIQSKRAELFCRFYPAQGEAEPPALMTEAQIITFLAENPAAHRIDEENTVAPVSVCAQLAAQASPQSLDFQPTPLYLRAPDVTMPKAS